MRNRPNFRKPVKAEVTHSEKYTHTQSQIYCYQQRPTQDLRAPPGKSLKQDAVFSTHIYQ